MAENNIFVPPFDVLRDIAAWFKEANVPGIVIGGIAVSILSRPRVTRDVDSLILLNDEEWEGFIKLGARFGFVPRLQGVMDFARKSRVLLMKHSKADIDIDISVGALPFEVESVERAVWIDVGGVSLPLPSPEDLIIMKAIAHRPIDMTDIHSILDVHPDIDFSRIRRWVGEFSAILEMPEIYDDLERILIQRKK
ncbi:MAG: nucleotidyltransferase [Deltaproteobacteria bacterium]|nr:nucleotidyltransferase [Deltaproteobacteria bacterium]